MIRQILILGIATIFLNTINAQFSDDMESYTDGTLIHQNHWTDWSGAGNNSILSSSTHYVSGNLSGYIPPNGSTDGILDLGNNITGQWGLKFMMYIPSNKEAQMNIQKNVPVGSNPVWAVGNIYFNKNNTNPGVGYVNYHASSSANWSYFSFPHDQWFEVIINININNNWQLLINGHVEIDWTEYGRWVSAGNFEYTNGLGGVNFFSSSSYCEYWIDDIDFISGFQTSTVSVNENLLNKDIKIFPNPSSVFLEFTGLPKEEEYYISDVLGNVVLKGHVSNLDKINIQNLQEGIYFVKLTNGYSQKIIKK